MHVHEAQDAAQLAVMRRLSEHTALLQTENAFEFVLPDKIYDSQLINIETPSGLMVQFIVPKSAKPGQRVRLQVCLQ